MWRYHGQERPPFADEPETDQESVWDYPRPPVIRPEARKVSVQYHGLRLAESDMALKVLETASAPGIYLPEESVDMAMLTRTGDRTFCEWKGAATYFDLNAGGESVRRVAWCYANPADVFARIAGFISFYPGKVDCYLDGELVRPQPGGFYGGWVTSNIAGPIKGAPGTAGW